jgi:hypothetical protein
MTAELVGNSLCFADVSNSNLTQIYRLFIEKPIPSQKNFLNNRLLQLPVSDIHIYPRAEDGHSF